MLSDGDQDGLMVSSGVDRSETVEALRETVGNVGGQDTILGRIVQTLEESKDVGVRGGRLLEAGDLLDNDVRMALNVSSAIDLLRSREVVLLGVDEVTGLKVGDSHTDGEGGVGLNGAKVGGELEFP